jgi:hypothetical protein
MTREQAFQELEEFVISSISSEERKHININVAKRVVEQICKERDYWKLSFEKQVQASRNAN